VWFEPQDGNVNNDKPEMVTCLRSVLMKPEHEAWLDRIWDRLIASCLDAMGE
jgi:tyrosine decarboxylase/aspartate 1-decarboxylase